MAKKIIIGNKEVGLYYCVGTAKELAKLVGGKLEKLSDYLANVSDDVEMLDRIENLILLFNKWYCMCAAANGKKVEPITKDELDMQLDPSVIGEYVTAITEAIDVGTKTDVEVKTIPQKNVRSGRKQSS